MAYNPWMTSNDIIEAVKRKIAFPVSQNTFSEEDILRFANEEMFISQVPSVLQYHEEYFVYRVQVPLVTNISRYSIPDRAIGMRLRDLMWSDSSGNFFEMTRISADDKAFFQRNIGANQAIHKFYIENNDVVLTPSVVGSPTGQLNFFIFMRPNQLVTNDRAATIVGFTQDMTVSSSYDYLFETTDVDVTKNTLSINSKSFTSADVNSTTGVFTINSHGYIDGTAVSLSGDVPAPLVANSVYYIVSATTNSFKLSETLNGSSIELTTSGSGSMKIARVHGYGLNKKIYFYSSGTLPSGLNAVSPFYVIPVSLSEFKVGLSLNGSEVDIASTGTGSHIISSNQVVITLATQTPEPSVYSFDILPRFTTAEIATNLQSSITTAAIEGLTASVNSATVTCTFSDATTTFVALNETAISVSSLFGFVVQTESPSLYNTVGTKIDLLQTKPGHKTYVFDVRVKAFSTVSTGVYSIKVNRSDLLVSLSNGYGFVPLMGGYQLGDYISLAGESIIPQLPPDLHNMLAEKTAARILASLGDQAGLAMANEKIKEMEYRQGGLLDDRVDGAPQKITARHSILRYFKMGVRKRM